MARDEADASGSSRHARYMALSVALLLLVGTLWYAYQAARMGRVLLRYAIAEKALVREAVLELREFALTTAQVAAEAVDRAFGEDDDA